MKIFFSAQLIAILNSYHCTLYVSSLQTSWVCFYERILALCKLNVGLTQWSLWSAPNGWHQSLKWHPWPQWCQLSLTVACGLLWCLVFSGELFLDSFENLLSPPTPYPVLLLLYTHPFYMLQRRRFVFRSTWWSQMYFSLKWHTCTAFSIYSTGTYVYYDVIIII